LDKSTIAEAVRLRAEGLSLRAIGKKLGIDQKQVQRWLKAAGPDRPAPARVVGLDGRNYYTSADSPREPKLGAAARRCVAGGAAGLYAGLWVIRGAINAEGAAYHQGKERGLAEDECVRLAGEAWRASLAKGGLINGEDQVGVDVPDDPYPPDTCLEGLVVELAQRLSPESLEMLHDDLWPIRCPQQGATTC
jgi:hypothetical protein